MRPVLSKPWRPLNLEEVRTVPASLGVYEIARIDGTIVDIGYAGGRSTFGLRGVLLDILGADETPRQFRVEINAQYMSRFDELLMSHTATFGCLPSMVADRGVRAPGRLRPFPAGTPLKAEEVQ
ncbi:DUF7508 domain-containing protein [Nocardia sp. NPDC004711]